MYENRIKALVRQDYFEVRSQNNQVYYVKNLQQLNVGDSITDCTDRRSQMVEGLISKYGEPDYHRDGAVRDQTFEHLTWDFSSKPNSRLDSEELEIYEANIVCVLDTGITEFALMKTETKVHSGKALVKSRDAVKVQRTFDAEL